MLQIFQGFSLLQIKNSPAIANGYVYFGSGDKNIYQLNASNVSQKIANYTTGSYASASTAIAYGYVYGGSYDNYVYQLNASNVSQLINRFGPLSDDVASSLTAANGYLYVGTDDYNVYQLNASNITLEIAHYTTGNKVGVGNGVVIAGDYAFVSSYDGYLYQLNASNVSQKITNFKLGSTSCQSYPAIVDGYVYISDAEKKIYKLRSGKTYINGIENSSNYTFPVYKNNENIEIGKEQIGDYYNGSVDEVVFFNHTLNSYEINSLYNSSAYPNFYHTFSDLSLGTHSYTVCAENSSGHASSSRRFFIFGILSGTTNEGESVGGILPSYIVKEAKLQEGQSRQLKKSDKIKLEFSNQGSKTLEIVNVDIDDNSVKVKINDIEVEIINGSSEKIDVNGDGYYDVEILNKKNYGTVSSLEFKSIHEEIESEEQESVQEEAKEEGADESGEEVDEGKKCKWYLYVIGGIVILVIGGYLFYRFRKRGKKK